MPLSFNCSKCGYHDRVFIDCIADSEIDIDCEECGETGCGNCIEGGKCEDCRELEADSVGALSDCIDCDGYVIEASEAPYCPTCARLKREGKEL